MLGRRLWAAAFITYFWAWLLPSLIVHVPFDQELRVTGWEATQVALSPIVPGHFGLTIDWSEWPWLILAVVTGLSNLLFVAALMRAHRSPRRVGARWEVSVWVAALLNTNWFVQGDYRQNLRIGYYLWVLSFVLLASALHVIRRAGGGAPFEQAAA